MRISKTVIAAKNEGAYVIEMTHRVTGVKKYICSAPVVSQDDIATLEIAIFDRYDEASLYPFLTEEQALLGGFSGLPATKNIKYSVVPVK